MTSILQLHVIRTNVLSNTSGLTSDNVCLTNIVEQRSLTVVYVTHDGYDRSTWKQVFFSVHFFFYRLRYFRTDIFSLISEFFGHQVNSFSIQALVDRNHYTYTHTCRDNLSNRHIHHVCQLVCSYKLCQFQDFAFFLFFQFQLLLTVLNYLTFLFTILGSFILSFVCKTSQCFFYLFCYVLIAYFSFRSWFFKTIFIVLTTAVLLSGIARLILSVIASTLRHAVIANSVDIHSFFVDAITLLLTRSVAGISTSLIRLFISFSDFLDNSVLHLLTLFQTLLIFFITFFTSLLFRFLLRTSRLIQCGKVNLSYHINL